MTDLIIHYLKSITYAEKSTMLSACGLIGGRINLTYDRSKITCKKCIKIIGIVCRYCKQNKADHNFISCSKCRQRNNKQRIKWQKKNETNTHSKNKL